MTDEQRSQLEGYAHAITPVTCSLGEGLRFLDASAKRLVAETTIDEHALNLRGFAHGGWLFTLCDACSAALVFSRGLDCVTLNATANYLAPGKPGTTLRIVVTNTHWGRTTIVNDVRIEDEDGNAIATSTQTMFVVGDNPQRYF